MRHPAPSSWRRSSGSTEGRSSQLRMTTRADSTSEQPQPSGARRDTAPVERVARTPPPSPRSDPQCPSARTNVEDAAPKGAPEHCGEREGISLGDMAAVAVHDCVADDHRTLTLIAEPASGL